MNVRHFSSKLFLVLLVIVMSLVTVVPVAATGTLDQAQSNDPVGYVNTGALNVRAGPGVAYHVVAVVYQGQQLVLVARNSSSTWVQVRIPGGPQGWVNVSLLNTSVAVGSLPVHGAPAPTAQAVVTTGAANVRSGPDIAYDPVAVVYQGSYLVLTGRNSNSSWVKVQVPGGPSGWINASLINSNVAINSLPVVGAPLGGPPTPPAYVATGALNVRSGPGVAYGVVGVVYQWQSMTLLGRNHNSTWVKARFPGGLEGWVNASLIHANVPVSSLPVLGAPVPAAQAYVNTGALNVRSGPGVAHRVVAVIVQGQYVGLIGRTHDGSWVQVQLGNGVTGWVNASYLHSNVPVSSLPVTV